MKHLKNVSAIILSAFLFFSFAACKKDDVAGDDWRVSGMVVGSGLISHGDEEAYVLATVNSKRAEFYWDQEEQVLYDTVDFPFEISDVDSASAKVTFSDLNGDDQTDVTVDLSLGGGDDIYFVWLWDSEKRYVFCEELSSYSDGQGDLNETASFEANNLEMNGDMDNGTYLLENGLACYTENGGGYIRSDCYWEVTKLRDETHNGIREIEFNAICYLPRKSVPGYTERFFTSVDSALYDYYTGTWLTASSSNPNSQHADNRYHHTVEFRDKKYDIEFSYSANWAEDIGDWFKVLTKNYIAYIPEEYDGLIFAAQTQPSSYKECMKRENLDSISPEANIMDCPTVEPKTGLYFAVCY